MKKFKRKIYQMLGSITMFVAVLSIVEVRSFCLLIIHQPDVPERLKEKMELM